MTQTEILEFFAKRDDAWQRHDSMTLAAGHAEDGEVDSPFFGIVKGRSAIENTYRQWFLSFPDAEYRTEHLLISGDRAAQFTRMSGTQKGDFCGLSPTGKRFEMRCAFLFFIADGQIVNEIRTYDFIRVLLQLGVLKAKPAH